MITNPIVDDSFSFLVASSLGGCSDMGLVCADVSSAIPLSCWFIWVYSNLIVL